jgi:predicted small secreted protein
MNFEYKHMKKRNVFQGVLLMSLMVLFACNTGRAKGKSVSEKEEGLVVLERIEWTNIWVEDTGGDSLPRLLLLGDSHVQQYYGFVKRELQGEVSFGRYTTSKCLGNPFLLDEIRLFLRQYPCDVIVFNNGLHGKDYPDSIYAAALPAVFRVFREEAPQASVIWVNTTPVREKENLEELGPFTDHVKMRNELAATFMEKHNIPVVDNWSVGYEHPEYYSHDGVHFNKAGKEAEARGVAAAVRKALEKR